MEKSFITVNNVYLHLKPIHLDIFMVLFGLFIIVTLVYIYIKQKETINKTAFLLISILITLNGLLIPWFIKSTALEITRFSGTSMDQATEKLMTPIEYTFYKELQKRLKPDDKFIFAETGDTYYLNIKTKHKLSFYLAPRLLAKNNEEADYVIVVNHKSTKNFSTPFPNNRLIPEYFIYDKLILLKVLDKEKND